MPDLIAGIRPVVPIQIPYWNEYELEVDEETEIANAALMSRVASSSTQNSTRRKTDWDVQTAAEMYDLVVDLHANLKSRNTTSTTRVKLKNRTIEIANTGVDKNPSKVTDSTKHTVMMKNASMLYPDVNMEARMRLKEIWETKKIKKAKTQSNVHVAALAGVFSFSQSQSTAESFYLRTAVQKNLWTTKVLSLLELAKGVGEEGDDLTNFWDTKNNCHFDSMTEEQLKDTKLYKSIAAKRICEKYAEIITDTPFSEDLHKWLGISRPMYKRGTAIEILNVTRLLRSQHSLGQQLIKNALTTTCGKPNTIDKFRHLRTDIPNAVELLQMKGAWVLHLGSGKQKCFSVGAYHCNVFCVDPVWDGKPEYGFRGTLEEFIEAIKCGDLNMRKLPTLISSDMCGYFKQTTHFVGKAGKGEMLTSMDPGVTNQLVERLITFFEDDLGYTGLFDVKIGVEDFPPEILACRAAILVMNQRPHNAELIVRLGKEVDDYTTNTVLTVMDAAAYAMIEANIARAHFESTNTFPNREFKLPPDFGAWQDNVRKHSVAKKPTIMEFTSRLMKESSKRQSVLDMDYLEHEDEGIDDDGVAYVMRSPKLKESDERLVQRILGIKAVRDQLRKLDINPYELMKVTEIAEEMVKNL